MVEHKQIPESKRMKSEGKLISRQYKNLYDDTYSTQPAGGGVSNGIVIKSQRSINSVQRLLPT